MNAGKRSVKTRIGSTGLCCECKAAEARTAVLSCGLGVLMLVFYIDVFFRTS